MRWVAEGAGAPRYWQRRWTYRSDASSSCGRSIKGPERFSIFKRLFDEHVMFLKWESIIQEMQLKVALYNKWRVPATILSDNGSCFVGRGRIDSP